MNLSVDNLDDKLKRIGHQLLDEVRTVGSRGEWLRPEFNHPKDLTVCHPEERYNPGVLNSISHGNIADRFIIVSDDPVNGKLPAPVRRILPVHLSKVASTPDSFVRLRPIKYELVTE